MKKWGLTVLTLTIGLLCILGACAGAGRGETAPSLALLQEPCPEPVYEFSDVTKKGRFLADDGTEVAHYEYHLLSMSTANMEELTPTAQDSAQKITGAFNDRFSTVMEQKIADGKSVGEDALACYKNGSWPGAAFYKSSTAQYQQMGNIISVRVDETEYSGGAHPWSTTTGYLFDLESGQFIEPILLAENPDNFRDGVAALLVDQANSLGEDYTNAYWGDYRDIISHWNDEAAALFATDGMTVLFSTYVLGPYAMGSVVLHIRYEELAPLLGESGLTRLGIKAGSLEKSNPEKSNLEELLPD